jgi:hypothetical protein
VYLDFADAIQRLGVETVPNGMATSSDVQAHVTDEDRTGTVRVCPAVHYGGRPAGGLHNLMGRHYPGASCDWRGELRADRGASTASARSALMLREPR